jgi:hypothetical protein
MPTFQREEVANAKVKLKAAQTRLTRLRTRHLQGDYIAKSTVENFVLGLAHIFRAEILNLPGLIRRSVNLDEIKNQWQLEDCVERAVDQWLLDFSRRPIPETPKPPRSKGAYTSKPGPKPGSKLIERVIHWSRLDYAR